MPDVPKLYRVTLQVSSLDKAQTFYAELLDIPGRLVGGGRAYFDCGPVILALVARGDQAQPNPDHLYLSVRDLEGIHARAWTLGCLSTEDVHGEHGGDIATRPWGERSFYVQDPFGNSLCFADDRTVFTGRRVNPQSLIPDR